MTTTATRRSDVHLTTDEAITAEFHRYADAVDHDRTGRVAGIRAHTLRRLRESHVPHVEDVDAEEMFRHATGSA